MSPDTFQKIDFLAKYNQIRDREEDISKTASYTKYELF